MRMGCGLNGLFRGFLRCAILQPLSTLSIRIVFAISRRCYELVRCGRGLLVGPRVAV